MARELKDTRGKRRGWWWKVPLVLLALLLAGLTIALLNIDAIARVQINKALNHYLAAGGEIAGVDIGLMEGRVSLEGLTINPPPTYGERPLLTWDALTVDVAPLSILTGRIVIETIGLKGLALSVVRDKQGRLNLLQIMNPVASGPDPGDGQSVSDPPWIPAVQVNSVIVEDLSLHLMDRMMDEKWSAGLHVDLTLNDLQLDDLISRDIGVGRIDVTVSDLSVDQPPGFSREPLLAAGTLALRVDDLDLKRSNTVVVSEIGLDTLTVSVERNANREVNLLKLVKSWLPAAEGQAGGGGSTTPDEQADSGLALPTVVVDEIDLMSISARVLDSIEGRPWQAGFEGLDIRIKGAEIGDIARQAVALASLDLDLRGVSVDQPPGFDTGKLFSLERLKVIAEKADNPGKELVIESVHLQGVTSSVTMRADGVSNLQVVRKALFGSDEAADRPTAAPSESREPSPTAPILPAVLFGKISLDGGPVIYRDEVFAEEPLTAALENIRMEAKGLRLFSDKAGLDPADASLSFELTQPGNLPTAYFGTLATVGPLGYGVPMVNAQVRLVGLKLDTLGSLVPTATRTALGATGLDAALALAMDADSINLNASVLTDHQIRYEGIAVQGPLDKPAVKIGPVMTGVFSRVSDGLVNMGKSGLKSGVDIAEGGIQAAKELGTGAIKVGANLGKNLFETVAGVVTLDSEKVKEGASGTTRGTIDLTKDSVENTGRAAGGGLKNSVSDLKGVERVRAWERDIPDRYRTTMQHAQRVLAEMPYPPVTD